MGGERNLVLPTKSGHNNGNDMTLHDISATLDMEYTRVSKVIKTLITKGILGKFETGNNDNGILRKVYIMNPYICSRGNNLTKTVENYFINSGWKIL